METVKEMCGDNRFEVIQRAKEHLLEATNIETSPNEMKVLDSFLFRAWQMEWLRQYEPTLRNATDTKVGGKSSPSDEWVSVDERLPEESGDYYDTVILSLKDGRTVAGCYRNNDKEWWGDITDGEYSNLTGEVTHWMPLPQPPKGVQ